MRKLTSVFLLFVSLYASARQISSGEAQAYASDFLNSQELQTATNVLTPMRAPGVNADAQTSPYYVFNRGEADGFVIISGDDRAPKILGYSDRGSFDASNLPPQLKAMMEQWATQMGRLPVGASQHPSWSKAPATRAGEVLLETANWGQDGPYNANAPIIDGEKCPTGCVATAMAIVMKYNKWPESFNWDSMPMNTESDPIDYSSTYPEIADLMAKVGEAVFMEYRTTESGAKMNWVGHKLQQDFKYSPDCQFITSESFDNEVWLDMLRSNLDNGTPVIYTGADKDITSSHAFVIDGYNSVGYHVNWGWDGAYNGYFVIDALTPNEVQDFSYQTGMVMNIVPDHSGQVYSDCFVDNGYFWSTAGFGDPMNISVENVSKDQPFTVINNQLTLAPNFDGEIGVALVGADNAIKEVLRAETCSSGESIQSHQCKFFNIKTTSDIDSGDRIQLVSKKNSEDNYKLILGTMEAPSSLPVNGNTPKVGKVRFNIQEGVKMTCYEQIWTDEFRIDIPTGTSEISVMRGLTLLYVCTKPQDTSLNPITLKIDGPLLYGTINSAGQQIQYEIDVVGDYEFNAQIAQLKDLDITLEKAGSLKDQISTEEAMNIRNLTISGVMNAFDFWYIRDNMPCLQSLDLGKVTIEECVGGDGNFVADGSIFEANTIPTFALTNLHSTCLRNLILPENLEVIGSDALVNFKIKSITIPEHVEAIGLNSFYSNRYLNAIELLNPDPVPVQECVFVMTKCPEEGVLYVPVGSAEKYRQAPVWQDFKTIVEGRMPEKTLIEGLTLDVDTCLLGIGRGIDLQAKAFPENATDKDVTWYSCDWSVATVEELTGRVVTMGEGETDIVGIADDLSGKMVKCHIIVRNLVERIQLNPDFWEACVGDTIQIAAEIYPTEASGDLIWTSSDESVATVDSTGKVSAVKSGEAIITASANDGSGMYASCYVVVRSVSVESISLNQTEAQLKVGENVVLTATVLPDNATDKTVTWTSDNEAVATVDADGNVTAISLGSATISASCGEVSASCVVTVVATPAESVSISHDEAQLKVGEFLTLSATVLPDNATDKTVIWTSSDDAVATVDSNGTVTAVAVGTATITASCGEVSATCVVTVEPILVESIQLTPDNWSGIEGESFSIAAIVLPENATDAAIEWSSSDETVATVDTEGNVYVIKPGTCVITAAAVDGSGVYAECIITGTSGIDGIFSGSDSFDIYDLGGIQIKKDADRETLKTLTPGIYILRNGSEMKKLVIR